jgi:hypothetical protein
MAHRNQRAIKASLSEQRLHAQIHSALPRDQAQQGPSSGSDHLEQSGGIAIVLAKRRLRFTCGAI